MTKHAAIRKKRKSSVTKNSLVQSGKSLAHGTRRKFLKMASVVSAAALLQQHAKGMAVTPVFGSKWLAAVRLEEVNPYEYYGNCPCDTDDERADESYNCGAWAMWQEQTNWCVEGLIIGLVNYYNNLYGCSSDSTWLASGQCVLFNLTHGTSNCCGYTLLDSSIPAACNVGMALPVVSAALYGVCHYGGYVAGSLCLDEIIPQIYANKPILIVISYASGDLHVQMITGYGRDYSTYPNLLTIDFSDPWYGDFDGIAFCDFENYIQAHWEYSWYTVPSTCCSGT